MGKDQSPFFAQFIQKELKNTAWKHLSSIAFGQCICSQASPKMASVPSQHRRPGTHSTMNRYFHSISTRPKGRTETTTTKTFDGQKRTEGDAEHPEVGCGFGVSEKANDQKKQK